jgi:ammonia channel protein AmtB
VRPQIQQSMAHLLVRRRLTAGIRECALANPSVMMIFVPTMSFLITAAAIPIGAMAERWHWKGLLLYGLWITLPYSIYANWIWGAVG